jgi:diguanylate cyclase (GGDEF)-like protein
MKLANSPSFFETDAQPATPVTGVTGFYPPAEPEQLITELQRENAKLRRAVAELESYRKLAYRDALTGLWNRRYFEERLSQEQSLARRKTSRRYSLMILDLNDLKRINDVDGHAAGDEAIKRAAAFLKSRLREHDVLCRVGGDEFAVILREMGPGECAQLVHRLRGELAKTNLRRPNSVSLSMGTASFPDDASNTRELYLRADEAMYQDKRRIKSAPTQTDLPFA